MTHEGSKPHDLFEASLVECVRLCIFIGCHERASLNFLPAILGYRASSQGGFLAGIFDRVFPL